MREYITSCLGDMMNKIPIKCPMSHDDCNVTIDTEIDEIDKLLTRGSILTNGKIYNNENIYR